MYTHSDVYYCYVVTTSNMREIACLELTPWLVCIIHAVCVVILIMLMTNEIKEAGTQFSLYTLLACLLACIQVP